MRAVAGATQYEIKGADSTTSGLRGASVRRGADPVTTRSAGPVEIHRGFAAGPVKPLPKIANSPPGAMPREKVAALTTPVVSNDGVCGEGFSWMRDVQCGRLPVRRKIEEHDAVAGRAGQMVAGRPIARRRSSGNAIRSKPNRG